MPNMDGWKRSVEAEIQKVGQAATAVDDEASMSTEDVKKQGIEQIITASFRAGFEAGASGQYRRPVVPIIEWDGLRPRITGFKAEASGFRAWWRRAAS